MCACMCVCSECCWHTMRSPAMTSLNNSCNTVICPSIHSLWGYFSFLFKVTLTPHRVVFHSLCLDSGCLAETTGTWGSRERETVPNPKLGISVVWILKWYSSWVWCTVTAWWSNKSNISTLSVLTEIPLALFLAISGKLPQTLIPLTFSE